MAYFKIGENDYSKYVSALEITDVNNYESQMNAAGDTVVDYISMKRQISVTIIPIDEELMKQLQADIKAFNVLISFLNPDTNELEENVNVILPRHEVKYYSIRANGVLFKEFELKFTEL